MFAVEYTKTALFSAGRSPPRGFEFSKNDFNRWKQKPAAAVVLGLQQFLVGVSKLWVCNMTLHEERWVKSVVLFNS